MRSPSAATEPGAVLHPTPPRPPGRKRPRTTGPALDGALATSEHPHAPEAHTHLGLFAETDQAGLRRAVATAPTARCVRRLERVRSNRCQRHVAKSSTLTSSSGRQPPLPPRVSAPPRRPDRHSDTQVPAGPCHLRDPHGRVPVQRPCARSQRAGTFGVLGPRRSRVRARPRRVWRDSRVRMQAQLRDRLQRCRRARPLP
jgi:hypothetical protein